MWSLAYTPFFVTQQSSSNPLRGKHKGIVQALGCEISGLKIEGAVMGLVFFSVQKPQIGLGATQTLKESLGGEVSYPHTDFRFWLALPYIVRLIG